MKWLMSLLVLVFVLPENSFAEAQCKITSRLKENSRRERLGSGALVQHDERLFFLTSSHVHFHSEEEADHSIACARGLSSKVALVATNFANGLALFEVEDEALSELALGFDEISTETISEGTSATLLGYAFDISPPDGHHATRVVAENIASPRHILPGVSHMYEFSGRSERGMSGGYAVAEDGSYIGMISHQYLSITDVGDEPVLNIYGHDQPEALEIWALVIPSPVIHRWFTSVLQDADSASLYEDFQFQRDKKLAIEVGGLRFEQVNCKRYEIEIGGDGIGIGGDGIGIGGDGIGIGGDGIGIGGDDEEGEFCQIVISGAPGSPRWPFDGNSEFVSDLAELTASGTVTKRLSGFYIEESDRVRVIGNLMQALSWLAAGHKPLLKIGEAPRGQLLEALRKLEANAVEADNKISQYRGDELPIVGNIDDALVLIAGGLYGVADDRLDELLHYGDRDSQVYRQWQELDAHYPGAKIELLILIRNMSHQLELLR